MGNVYLTPRVQGEHLGGVVEAVRALARHLPAAGWGVAARPEDADVIHAHALVDPMLLPRLDVYTNHGMYADGGNPYEEAANVNMRRAILAARITTSVAAWPLARYAWMGAKPRVIRNGVSLAEMDRVPVGAFRKQFSLPEKQPVAVWGKIGIQGVTADGFERAAELAYACPKIIFAFTNWPEGRDRPRNVLATGPLDRLLFLEMVRDADVFLSTTVENFPLAVLEAMALRRPVLALNEGGNAEIPLASPGFADGDLSGAVAALASCLLYRDDFGAAHRRTIEAEFTWEHVTRQYAALYDEALRDRRAEAEPTAPVASIVITSHNLEAYIERAVMSAVKQTFNRPFEVIVVDDASSDGSRAILKGLDKKAIRLIQHRKNAGVVASRNEGVAAARGRFVCCLDGDDQLNTDFLAKNVPVLEGNPLVGVAVPRWVSIDAGGKQLGGPFGQAGDLPLADLMKGNSVPCFSLFRKKAWDMIGGQKPINPSWEDYEGWLAMAEVGFLIRGAEGDPTAAYTVKGTSGRNAESQDQTARLRATVNAYHPRLFRPTVSVVIPTFTHPEMVGAAVGSVMAQTDQGFEIVVVDDGASLWQPGKLADALKPWAGDPRLRVIEQENRGLPAARNAGIEAASGKYILPLDDDDTLEPDFLKEALAVQAGELGVLAYADFRPSFDDGSLGDVVALDDYSFDRLLRGPLMPACCLYRREVWAKVGGYDEEMTEGLEDWEFSIRAGVAGACGRRIAKALWRYRQHDGGSMRTEMLASGSEAIRAYVIAQHRELYRGGRPMGCCGGNRGRAATAPVEATPQLAGAMPGAEGDFVSMKYVGGRNAPVTIRGYRACVARPFVLVKPSDVAALLETGQFVRV